MKKIYLKKKPKSVLELLHRVIFEHEKTFNDPECKDTQTLQGRERSIKDIKKVLKTYYKSKGINKGIKMMKKLYSCEISCKFYCSDIKRQLISPHSCLPIEIDKLKEILNE